MNKKWFRFPLLMIALMVIVSIASPAAQAGSEKQKVTIGWSRYAGWMPWPYLKESGLMQKWADAYGCTVDITNEMSYDASIAAYASGELDGVTITNMDAIQGPCRSGRKTVALVNGDFSNGNDCLIAKGVGDVPGLKGMKVMMLEGSVSQYLTVQGLVANKMKESDITIVNVSDAVIAATYLADDSATKAVTTWTPFTLQVLEQPGSKVLFDSSKIPGHIQDWLMVSEETAKNKPNCCKAIMGAWCEGMKILSTRGEKRTAMVASMAKASECTAAAFEAQLKTTALYTTAQSAFDCTSGKEIQAAMKSVKEFCVAHPPADVPASTIEAVGIKFPDGSVLGDAKKVMLTLDASFTELAAKGELKRE